VSHGPDPMRAGRHATFGWWDTIARKPTHCDLVAICLIGLAGVGCVPNADEARWDESTVTLLYPIDERGLGPMSGEASRFLVFLPLVAHTADGELEGRLARSWERSPDYRTWTIHLRTDIRWQDGVPVTAHDVKFTLDLYSHREVQWELPDAYEVTVLDDSTYTITYGRRSLGSPLDNWTVYLPKHLLEGLDPKDFHDWEFWKRPIGNGPYRHVRTVPKTMIEVEANPDYYRGEPRIKRVVLKFGDASLIELMSGNVDAIINVNRVELLKLKDDPRFRVYHYAFGVQETAVYWNQQFPPFHDLRVRRALTLAINRPELHKLVNLPAGTPAFDVIFTEQQYHRGEIPLPLPYDQQEARRLLDEAGWRDSDGDGIRERDGVPFRFSMLVMHAAWSGGTLRDQAAVFIQDQLAQVGIGMEINTLDIMAGRELWRAGKFEAAIVTSMGGERAHLARFSHDWAVGHMNPRVVDLLQAAAATMNPHEVDSIYRQLQPVFQTDLPFTGLYPTLWTSVTHRRLRGLSTPYRADPAWYMEELWIEEQGETENSDGVADREPRGTAKRNLPRRSPE